MPESAVTLRSGGSTLAATWRTPAGAGPFPCVACIHGLTLTQGLFDEASAALAAAGVASLRVDLRGHGASQGELKAQGFDDQVADVRAAFVALAGMPGADPARRGLLGFSMGGAMAALVAVADSDVRALALWSPLLKTGPWNLERQSQYGAPQGGLQEIWDRILVNERLFSEAVRHDPYAAAVNYAGPAFFCHGGKDRNHPQARSMEAAADRQRAGRDTATYFPPLSGHRYHVQAERARRDALTAAFLATSL